MPQIREASEADLPAIAAIYNQGIRGRNSTFETRERSVDDIRGWLGNPKGVAVGHSRDAQGIAIGDTRYARNLANLKHPVLVAEEDGKIMGWISASTYRARECYAGIAEFSVYVAGSAHGKGIGSALMQAFIPACEQAGLWKMLSRIFPENTASLALCRKFGFREVGVYHKHGKLEGVWRDVVIVERLIEGNLK